VRAAPCSRALPRWHGHRPLAYPGAPGSQGRHGAACRGGAALSGWARRLPGRAGEFYTEAEHADAMKATFERWYTTAFQSLQVRARWRRAAGVPALRVAAPAARGASPREGPGRGGREAPRAPAFVVTALLTATDGL